MKDIEGYKRFDTWVEVLAWVELGGEVYYQAPMDPRPRRVSSKRSGQQIRVSPLVGTNFDSFLADEDHRGRFLREDMAPSSNVEPEFEETRKQERSTLRGT